MSLIWGAIEVYDQEWGAVYPEGPRAAMLAYEALERLLAAVRAAEGEIDAVYGEAHLSAISRALWEFDRADGR